MCVSCFVWMGVREGGWTRPGPPLHWTGQRWHCSCEQLFNVCSAAICVNKDICLQLLMCVVWRILIGFSHSLYHPVITRQLLPLFGFSGVSVSDRYSHMSPVSAVNTTISYDKADHTLLYLNFKPVDYWLILDMSYILKGFFFQFLFILLEHPNCRICFRHPVTLPHSCREPSVCSSWLQDLILQTYCISYSKS